MIHVQRSPAPLVLSRNGVRWREKLLLLLATAPTSKDNVSKARSRYNHREIKESLRAMFHGKCAYCESRLTVVSYAEIDHFRPFCRYPELTFEWTNLLLSCQICNGASHKGDTFPTQDGQALLLDPTDAQDAISDHLDFVWDERTRCASVIGRSTRGSVVVETFDLNGLKDRTDLVAQRSRHLSRSLALMRMADEGDEVARDLVRQLCEADEEYRAFLRKYITPRDAAHPRQQEG